MDTVEFKKEEERIEAAVGELAAAIYALSQKDVKAAFHNAGAAVSVISGMRTDMITTGRIKYDDL